MQKLARRRPAPRQNLTPTISDRHVKSSIVVADGQTVLLAGLIQDTGGLTKNGIPGLDQIPVVGNVFEQQLIQSRHKDRTHHLHPSSGHPRRRRRVSGRRGIAFQDARREGRQHLSDGGRDSGADACVATVESAMNHPLLQPLVERAAALGVARPGMLKEGAPLGSRWGKRAALASLACAMMIMSFSAAQGPQGWLGAALALLMFAIAVSDARSLLIPNWLSLTAFLLALAAAAHDASQDFSPAFWLPAAQAIGFSLLRAARLASPFSGCARSIRAFGAAKGSGSATSSSRRSLALGSTGS